MTLSLRLKSILFLSTVLLSCSALADNTYSFNPKALHSFLDFSKYNLAFAKKQLIQYHDSGKYMYDIAQIDQQAGIYLQARADKNNQLSHPKHLAIVFDIDETTLSNYPDMFKLNFGGTLSMIKANIAKATDPAIQPSLELYRLAEKDHVAVFFITGRDTTLKNPTIKNLQHTGYIQWNALYLKPINYNKPSVVPFKSSIRKQIEHQGYDVIIDIGDQQSDLDGGFAEKTFKLPNPYYYIS